MPCVPIIASLLLAACGGDDGSVPDTAEAPRDLIAFGGRATDGDGQYGLYLVRPDGSELRKVTDESGFIFVPRWSPTGEHIAYIVGTEGQERPGALRLYDPRTGSASTVSERASPSLQGLAAAWSPDGRRLAFVEAVGEGRLRVFDVDRAELLDLPDMDGTAPDWSPTGDELVFVSAAGAEETDLYLTDEDGEDPRRLLERRGVEGNPRWSPDGERIAVWSAPADRLEERELLVIDRDGGAVTELGPGFGAAWSPDGTQLAYSAPAPGNAANLEIFIVALDSGESQPLSPEVTVTVDGWPAWSPDGERLAYLAQVDRQTAFLCVAQPETRERSCLNLPEGVVPGAPAWR